MTLKYECMARFFSFWSLYDARQFGRSAVNINIDGAGKNAREIANQTRQEYQNMALARFGTITRWAETQ